MCAHTYEGERENVLLFMTCSTISDSSKLTKVSFSVGNIGSHTVVSALTTASELSDHVWRVSGD